MNTEDREFTDLKKLLEKKKSMHIVQMLSVNFILNYQHTLVMKIYTNKNHHF